MVTTRIPSKIEKIFSDIYKPKIVKYFIDNKINTINIECGAYHTLAIDSNNNVYSWGSNLYPQCGHGINPNKKGKREGEGEFEEHDRCINTPKLIICLSQYNIVNIGCGAFHSYIK